jgi:small GTP-binding protein
MIRKKICVLGSFAVGKTSLVRRFVSGIFSDKYLTTLGVKIDKKKLLINNQKIEFIIWDLAGEDEFITVRESYLRGCSAYLLVADGTRKETLDVAHSLHQRMKSKDESLPFIFLLNKSDLKAEWEINKKQIKELSNSGWTVIETSAKNNLGVSDAFQLLAIALLEKS